MAITRDISLPSSLRSRVSGVSKDEADIRASWVLLAMRSIVQRRRAVISCRSLTASLTLGLLGHARPHTMRI